MSMPGVTGVGPVGMVRRPGPGVKGIDLDKVRIMDGTCVNSTTAKSGELIGFAFPDGGQPGHQAVYQTAVPGEGNKGAQLVYVGDAYRTPDPTPGKPLDHIFIFVPGKKPDGVTPAWQLVFKTRTMDEAARQLWHTRTIEVIQED